MTVEAFQQAHEALAALLTERLGTQGVADARKSFSQTIGEMHDDEPGFDQWLNLFLEDLIFCQRDGDGRTLYDRAVENAPPDAPWKGIDNIRRSVWLVKKLKNEAVEMEDIWYETSFKIPLMNVPRLEKGDVLQAIVATWNGEVVMLGGVFIHMPETRELVLSTVKKIRKRELKAAKKEKRTDGLARDRFDPLRLELERMWVRAARYRKLSPEVIYREGLSRLVA